TEEKALMAELRLVRQRGMIEIMRRDLQGKADLFEVTEALSFLADAAVQIALKFSHKMQAERFGEPADGDCMMVVGMVQPGWRDTGGPNRQNPVSRRIFYTGWQTGHQDYFRSNRRRLRIPG
ncbi:MAG: hypothetical protein ACLGGW_04650, partial [Gammaproteobacteria bacterium]